VDFPIIYGVIPGFFVGQDENLDNHKTGDDKRNPYHNAENNRHAKPSPIPSCYIFVGITRQIVALNTITGTKICPERVALKETPIKMKTTERTQTKFESPAGHIERSERGGGRASLTP
jgi:hypothetical protein